MKRWGVATAVVLISAPAAMAQDRMFNNPDFPPEIHAQPRWVVAAHCAALYETHDAVMERDRAAHAAAEAAKGRPLPPHSAETLAVFARMSEGARSGRRSMTEYGLARLGRDRPGQDAGATFEAEVRRQRTAHEALNRTARDYNHRATSCGGVQANIASDRGYLLRGWPDRRDTADGQP